MRIFVLGHVLPADLVDRLAQRQLPPLQSSGTEPVHGWTGGRHALDVPITEENAMFGGHLRVQLVRTERKVPKKLLESEIALECQAHMRAENEPFVDRRTRSEIRKNVMARLLPGMPPTIKAIPMVALDREKVLFAGATSESQADAFRVHFRNVAGFDCVPLTPEVAAALLDKSARDWGKTSFSPEVPDTAMDETVGADFLTWLWFASEARGGLFETVEHGRVAVAVEGPLQFAHVGEGAHLMALRDGLPTVSAEAKAALLAGKKLVRCKLHLGRAGDETWSCSLDADWVIRGLKLPEPGEMLDAASAFQDRVQRLDQFRELLLDLFDQFANERGNPAKWQATRNQIHSWVLERKGKS